MSLDKFGRRSGEAPYSQIPEVTFPHTPDGDLDIKNVKLCNVKPPTTTFDATTKGYVDQLIFNHQTILNTLQNGVKNIQQINVTKKHIDNIEREILDLELKINEKLSFITITLDKRLAVPENK